MTSLTDDCPICFEKFSSPVKLECNHYFCFACIRRHLDDTSIQRQCPVCRRAISATFDLANNVVNRSSSQLFSISLLSTNTVTQPTRTNDDSYDWYYEGRNGWWKYDANTSRIIEQSYQNNRQGQIKCSILGHVYLIDFKKMLQVRQDDTTRIRKIKRDSSDAIFKGIAGLRI